MLAELEENWLLCSGELDVLSEENRVTQTESFSKMK